MLSRVMSLSPPLNNLRHRPKVNPGCVSLDTPQMITCRCALQTCDPLPDLFATVGEPLAPRHVFLVSRPRADDLPAVLQFRRDNRPRQLQRAGIVPDCLEQSCANVNVAVGSAIYNDRMAPLRRKTATRTPRRTQASKACMVTCALPNTTTASSASNGTR